MNNEGPAKAPYKRRQYFINKGFQAKFILKFCLLIILGAIISTSLLFLFSQNTLTSSFENSRLVIQSTAQMIMPLVLYTNLATIILISVATIIVTLFVSHKIAGPLFRIEKGLNNVAEGNLTCKIHLRRKDQITVVADSYNNMIASLQHKIISVQEKIEMLGEDIRKNKQSKELEEKLKELEKQISQEFKL